MEQIIRTKNYINGEWLDNSGGKLEVINKYSSEKICDVSVADSIQVELAISSSQKAFGQLSKITQGERAKYLERLAAELKVMESEFTDLIIAEAGKPRAYAKMEVQRCIDTLSTAAREAYSFAGEVVAMDYNNGEGKTAFTKRMPTGPILGISPFNFPLNLALHKIAPAIATGNPIILKPAPQAPLSVLAFAALVEKAGLPKGSVNILVCDIPEAQKMVSDSRIKILSFTGSPEIGWKLKDLSGKKKVQLELGGNAASVVDADSDWKSAAKKLAIASFLYSGQICISTQRIYVHKNIFNEFTQQFISESKKIRSGDPDITGNHNGPLISRDHLVRIRTWVEDAEKSGARILLGGKVYSEEHNIFENTILTDTDTGMKVNSEEAFAPLVVVEKFSDFNEAIALVNDSKYGLQASLFTNDLEKVKKAHLEIQVGALIINDIPGFRIDSMPYGGVKDSGLGREGIKYTMEEYTEARMLVY